MPFVNRFLLDSKARPQGRIYVHQAGHQQFQDIQGEYSPAYNHVVGILDDHLNLFYSASHIIGALWANEQEKRAEVFSYGDFEGWEEANPTGYTFVFRNGVWRPDLRNVGNETTCEDTDIARGREAEFRRKTKSLDEYLLGTPDLPPGLLVE